MLREMIQNVPLVSCQKTTPLTEVAQQMKSKNVGAVLVVENHKPVGIITDRDLAIRCIAEGHHPKDCVAQDVMSDQVFTVRETDGIYDAIACMKKSKIRRVPIVNAQGEPIGLISQGDLFSLLSRELEDLARGTTHFETAEKGAEKAQKKIA